MPIDWTAENNQRLIDLRGRKVPFSKIAELMGTTKTAVKHRHRRLTQPENLEKFHHPAEKIDQIRRLLSGTKLRILETNAGWGNLTGLYREYGGVLALEIDEEKVDHIASQEWAGVVTRRCDSELEMHRLVADKAKFDVVDLDPYGYPARYLPHVLDLIDDGYLFMTIPVLGTQLISRITTTYLEANWGFTMDQKPRYEEIIHERMHRHGMTELRQVEPVDRIQFDRVYRFAYRVQRVSRAAQCGYTNKPKQVEPKAVLIQDRLF